MSSSGDTDVADCTCSWTPNMLLETIFNLLTRDSVLRRTDQTAQPTRLKGKVKPGTRNVIFKEIVSLSFYPNFNPGSTILIEMGGSHTSKETSNCPEFILNFQKKLKLNWNVFQLSRKCASQSRCRSNSRLSSSWLPFTMPVLSLVYNLTKKKNNKMNPKSWSSIRAPCLNLLIYDWMICCCFWNFWIELLK